MNNDRKKLIPELRFPEFVNDIEWKETFLEELCELITKGTTPTTVGFKYIDQGVNFIKIESIENGEIDLSKVAHISTDCHEALGRSQLKENDILFSIAGALGVVTSVSKNTLPANTNQALSIIRLKKGYNKNYILNFLLSSFITEEVLKLKAGAAQLNISLSQIAKFKILLPNNLIEQQKIASCLSSLDQLITAQKEKLELLKKHKKGLMQNLFPQEGETVPTFRFPEFDNDGDWEEKKLGDITENVMYGMNASAIKYDGENKYIRITDIDENSRTFSENSLTSPNGQLEEKYILKIGDLLFARTGASVGKSYLHQKENGKIYFAGFLIRLTIKNEIPYFIYAQTLTDLYFKWVIKTSMRSGQPGLNAEEYKSYRVFIPPSINEQEKNASCLSSLDSIISSQTDKIGKLQLHKKGLMQGLFPKTID